MLREWRVEPEKFTMGCWLAVAKFRYFRWIGEWGYCNCNPFHLRTLPLDANRISGIYCWFSVGLFLTDECTYTKPSRPNCCKYVTEQRNRSVVKSRQPKYLPASSPIPVFPFAVRDSGLNFVSIFNLSFLKLSKHCFVWLPMPLNFNPISYHWPTSPLNNI